MNSFPRKEEKAWRALLMSELAVKLWKEEEEREGGGERRRKEEEERRGGGGERRRREEEERGEKRVWTSEF